MPHPILDRPGHTKPRTPEFSVTDVTDSGDTTVLTVGDTQQAFLFYFIASNGGEASREIEVKFGSTVKFGFHLKDGQTALMNFIGAEPLTGKGEDIKVNLDDAGTVKISVGYLRYTAR